MNNYINLTPAALNWLGSAFEKKTRISPFANISSAGFSQEGLADLIKQGVVTEDKSMTTEAYALLEVLAGARQFASVHLTGGSGHVNRVTYWKGETSVSLDNKGSFMTLSPGNQVEALEIIFQEITGSNRLISSNFTASFDHRSALVFAGLFDLSRQAAIRLYADGTDIPDGFSLTDIIKFISDASNGRWLTSHIKTLNIPPVDGNQAAASLASLTAAGVIGTSKDGLLFNLAYDSAQLAAHFLFIENTVHFRSGSEQENGSLASAECLFLQAGLHDVIMVDLSAKGIEVSAVSSYAMIEDIKTLMTASPNF